MMSPLVLLLRRLSAPSSRRGAAWGTHTSVHITVSEMLRCQPPSGSLLLVGSPLLLLLLLLRARGLPIHTLSLTHECLLPVLHHYHSDVPSWPVLTPGQ
jgi:hypothetical protein